MYLYQYCVISITKKLIVRHVVGWCTIPRASQTDNEDIIIQTLIGTYYHCYYYCCTDESLSAILHDQWPV